MDFPVRLPGAGAGRGARDELFGGGRRRERLPGKGDHIAVVCEFVVSYRGIRFGATE